MILKTREAQADLLNMMVAIRSYWLSNDGGYLATLRGSERDLNATLAKISTLVGDNPEQGRRVLDTSSLTGNWVGTIQTLVAQKNAGQSNPIPLAELDKQAQAVSHVFDEIVSQEDRPLAQRSVQQRNEGRLTFLLVPLLFGLGALVPSYWGLREIDRATQRFALALTKAEEANRAKDNFLSTVSHELRNPLSAIMLSDNVLLSDQELPEIARQRARGIERAARLQAQLIEDLLDVSRIEAGRLRLDVQATDLAQVVKAAVDSMRLAAEAKSITLHEVIDSNVGLIAGDPKRLEQVVWNFISNAIKFTPRGGKVQVRLERIDSYVEIIVTDNGQGIAASSLPRVFDRFWQQAEPDQGGVGVGLGLSIDSQGAGGSPRRHRDGP